MPVCITSEGDDVEEDEPEHGPRDDRYCHLVEEIHIKDMNIAAMTARMDELMAQLQTTHGIELAPGRQGPPIERHLHPQILRQCPWQIPT